MIPSPSTSVKIQIMGGKVCLRCKGKTLLGVVNKLRKQKVYWHHPAMFCLITWGRGDVQIEKSIPSIFLESPHQLDMKNVVKSSKHFFWYFNTLETHSDMGFSLRISHLLRSILVHSTIWGWWKVGKSGVHILIKVQFFLLYLAK